MKKQFALFLAAALILTLAACGGKSSGDRVPIPQPSAASEEREGKQSIPDSTAAESGAGSTKAVEPPPSGEPRSFTTVRPGTSGEQSVRETHYFEGVYKYTETVNEYVDQAAAQMGYQYLESLGWYDDLKLDGSTVSYQEEYTPFAGKDYDTALEEQKNWMKAQPEAYEDVELIENQ